MTNSCDHSRNPQVSMSLSSVQIHPGETLTVWLHRREGTGQVELRVLPDGTPEVWLSSEIVRDWAEGWYPMSSGKRDE